MILEFSVQFCCVLCCNNEHAFFNLDINLILLCFRMIAIFHISSAGKIMCGK